MSYKEFRQAAKEAILRQRMKQQNKGLYLGKSWGLYDLDQLTGGIQLPICGEYEGRQIAESGKLYFVLGQHKIGKTAFLTTCIRALGKQNVPFFYISGEQDELSIAMLTLIAEAKIDRQDVRDLKVSNITLDFLEVILEKQANFDGVLGFSINRLSEIWSSLKEINKERENPVRIILFDYFQLMQVEEHETVSNRTRQLENLSRRLTRFKEDYTIVVASQANLEGGSFLSSQPLKDADGILTIGEFKDNVTNKKDKSIRTIEAIPSRDWGGGECQVYFRSANNAFEDINVKKIDTMEFKF